jgi:hypothetical protein
VNYVFATLEEYQTQIKTWNAELTDLLAEARRFEASEPLRPTKKRKSDVPAPILGPLTKKKSPMEGGVHIQHESCNNG